ncbi:MAG: hypothetical protein M3N00_09750 [Actinomycetota bacterium]|nr:hypothetical protein [Actinomycetota bacterium]
MAGDDGQTGADEERSPETLNQRGGRRLFVVRQSIGARCGDREEHGQP